MITQRHIEALLTGEISEHFTVCGEDQASYARLLISDVNQRDGTVSLHGYDTASRMPFTATVHVNVTADQGERTRDQ